MQCESKKLLYTGDKEKTEGEYRAEEEAIVREMLLTQ